jgi:hypothetical protein
MTPGRHGPHEESGKTNQLSKCIICLVSLLVIESRSQTVVVQLELLDPFRAKVFVHSTRRSSLPVTLTGKSEILISGNLPRRDGTAGHYRRADAGRIASPGERSAQVDMRGKRESRTADHLETGRRPRPAPQYSRRTQRSAVK